jgi:hypothetical protein
MPAKPAICRHRRDTQNGRGINPGRILHENALLKIRCRRDWTAWSCPSEALEASDQDQAKSAADDARHWGRHVATIEPEKIHAKILSAASICRPNEVWTTASSIRLDLPEA